MVALERTEDPSEVLRRQRVFRTADAERLGVSQSTVSRLASAGIVVRLGWGIYHHRDADVDVATLDYVVATLRFGPGTVIGGMTALVHHALTEQVPSQLWVMVPPTVRGKIPPLYRVIRTKHAPTVGVDHGAGYLMATPERAIAEALRYKGKIGLENALAAAKIAFKYDLTTAGKILEVARALGIDHAIWPHWEALLTLEPPRS